MSRYLMVLWSGGGAVPPQLAIAKRLLRAGHHVAILAPRSLEDAVTATGASFRPYRRAPEHDLTDPDHDLLRDWEARGLSAAARMRDNVMFGTAPAICDDVVAIADDARPDVLVTDYVLLGSYIAAERIQIPLAALLHTIYTLPRPGVPPFGPGFQPARHAPARLRDALLKKLQRRFYNGRTDDLNELRRRVGLPPLDSTLDLIFGADRLLILSSQAFDYPGPVSENSRWVGVISDPDVPSPVPGDRGSHERKSVLVSFSTTYQRQAPVLERVVDALAGLPVDAVVTCGPAIAPGELPTRRNVRVTGSIPHHELLPSVDLVITHGGHGTVTAALGHGVPVLCLPMGRDQRDIAARVVWRGVGRRASARSSVRSLRAAVRDTLADPGLRAAAMRLAADMATDDPDLAVRELEGIAHRERSSQGRQPTQSTGRVAPARSVDRSNG